MEAILTFADKCMCWSLSWCVQHTPYTTPVGILIIRSCLSQILFRYVPLYAFFDV